MCIKTIILHCKLLVDRKQHMITQVNKYGFSDYTFYEDFDGSELTDDIVSKYCVRKIDDPVVTAKKILPWGIGLTTQRELTIPEISLSIKFGKSFELFSQIDSKYFILFEDDVILCDKFNMCFYSFLQQTPADWDVIYFGSGAGLRPNKIVHNKVAYLMNHPASRCADSILIKKSAVLDLVKTWFPFHLISDWELGYQHSLHNHKVYWWEPSLTVQGSECGLFKSALR